MCKNKNKSAIICVQNLCYLYATMTIICGLYACASTGTPGGGTYDETPPRFVKSTPEPNSTHFKGKQIEIQFNELIQLDKPSEKIIITPPQKDLPVIRAMGKKVRVELMDSLILSTTYTIDFTNSIVDNNEKNALENFSFAFSTGESLDSLILSGVLLNAENLEPMPNIMIGLHTNLEDSAFTSLPFVRTTKTNDKGHFWVRNVKPGTYRIHALNDKNRDYKFDQPGEEIAFLDSLFIPSFESAIRQDTIRKDSITIDTIMVVPYTRFTPDDIRLFLFKEKFSRQYLVKSERTDNHRLTFTFNTSNQTIPEFRLLDVESEKDWFVPEYENDRSIIHYWIKDSTVCQTDTLMIEAFYMKSDSLNQLVPQTDTLALSQRKTKNTRTDPKKKEEKIEFLNLRISLSSTADVFDTLKITFDEPLIQFDPELIHMELKVDTLWEIQSFPITQDSLNPRLYSISPPWTYGSEYRLTVDSASFYSIYGKWNKKVQSSFKFRKEDEYGTLTIAITGNMYQGFGELLDSGEKLVKKAFLKDGKLEFINVKPGKYYLRYVEDRNENGRWDSGNYKQKIQPESVFYHNDTFEIRINFDHEQSKPWDIHMVPIEKQKPIEITKNKPAEKKRRPNEQNTKSSSNQRSNSNFSNPMGRSSMPF